MMAYARADRVGARNTEGGQGITHQATAIASPIIRLANCATDFTFRQSKPIIALPYTSPSAFQGVRRVYRKILNAERDP